MAYSQVSRNLRYVMEQDQSIYTSKKRSTKQLKTVSSFSSLPFVKGGSFNAVPLSSLVDVSEEPTNLSRVSKNKAIVHLVSKDGKKDSLVLVTLSFNQSLRVQYANSAICVYLHYFPPMQAFDNSGKFVSSNVMRGTKPGAAYLVAGCKNSDDLILLEQECGDKSASCKRFGPQVHHGFK